MGLSCLLEKVESMRSKTGDKDARSVESVIGPVILEVAPILQDLLKLCEEDGCGAELSLPDCIGGDKFCRSKRGCANAAAWKHWMHCAVMWGAVPGVWVCAFELVMFMLHDQVSITTFKIVCEQFIRTMETTDKIELMLALTTYNYIPRVTTLPSISRICSVNHVEFVRRREAEYDVGEISPELLESHDQLYARQALLCSQIGCSFEQLQECMDLQIVESGAAAMKEQWELLWTCYIEEADDNKRHAIVLKMKTCMSLAKEEELFCDLGQGQGAFRHLFWYLKAWRKLRKRWEKAVYATMDWIQKNEFSVQSGMPSEMPSKVFFVMSCVAHTCYKEYLKSIAPLPAAAEDLMRYLITCSPVPSPALSTWVTDTICDNNLTCRVYKLFAELFSLHLYLLIEVSEVMQIKFEDNRDRDELLPLGYRPAHYSFGTRSLFVPDRSTHCVDRGYRELDRRSEDIALRVAAATDDSNQDWLIFRTGHLPPPPPDTNDVSYDNNKNKHMHEGVNIMAPGCDTLQGGYQTTAIHKLRNIMQTMEVIIGAPLGLTDKQTLVDTLNELNKFDARAMTEVIRTLWDRFSKTMPTTRILELFDTVLQHVKLVAKKTGYVGRTPYSIASWVLTMHNGRRCNPSLENVFMPMCAQPIGHNHEEDTHEELCNITCTHCLHLFGVGTAPPQMQCATYSNWFKPLITANTVFAFTDNPLPSRLKKKLPVSIGFPGNALFAFCKTELIPGSG